MQPVFTAAEMRGCDRAAVERYGVPGIVLMENASRGAVDLLECLSGPARDRHALVLCGRGNNGGDGYAAARHLLNRGARVTVLGLGLNAQPGGDAAANLDILRRALPDTRALRLAELDEDVLDLALQDAPGIVVDAMLGTGLNTVVTDPLFGIIERVSAARVPVFALDIPTGIDSDTGQIHGTALRASWTAAMGGLKRGHLFGAGREYSGDTRVVDIGMPVQGFFETATATWRIESSDAKLLLPLRESTVNKYSVGSVCIAAGSTGMAGAAALAAEGAMRAGAGITRLAIPSGLHDPLVRKLTEIILLPLPETAQGTIKREGAQICLAQMQTSSAAAIGPGLSRNDDTIAFALDIIDNCTSPLVIDADALYALTGRLDLLRTARAPRILTPHAGEFHRLSGIAKHDIHLHPVDVAREFALQHGCTLVLKGAPSVVATAEGQTYVSSAGNPGMATAGSGDVLTGIITGLLAQGLSPVAAALCGVHIHGQAGDRSAAVTGIHSLLASDILHAVPETIRLLAGG